jgi:hypothetical protein
MARIFSAAMRNLRASWRSADSGDVRRSTAKPPSVSPMIAAFPGVGLSFGEENGFRLRFQAIGMGRQMRLCPPKMQGQFAISLKHRVESRCSEPK